MTDERRCGLCGAPARAPFRAPAPEISPDLDLRPGEPARATLPDWMQTCASCGAVAFDLATLAPAAQPLVGSEAWRAMAHVGAAETVPFRRWAALCRAMGDAVTAVEATLMAAWAADDAAAVLEAAQLRGEVARDWGAASDTLTALRRLDVLRRTSDFAAAEAWADQLAARPLDAAGAAVLAFQRRRIAMRDIGGHLLSSALPPPLTPDAFARPAFWEWLFRA